MSPRIESGQLCTVEPVDPSDLRSGDIVLCKVRGTEYLHFELGSLLLHCHFCFLHFESLQFQFVFHQFPTAGFAISF